LVTPFVDGEVDTATFRKLIDRQLDAGGHGVTVAGTTGEPASLSLGERSNLFAVATEQVNGRATVIAGTGTIELRDTLSLTEEAYRSGADAALVVTPAFSRPSQAGLLSWFTTVADASKLPVILYDIPGRSGVGLTVDTTAQLAEHDNVIGVKIAHPDLVHTTRVMQACGPDFRVLCGVESLCFPMLALGGAGHVSATGNIFPDLVARLADLSFEGDYEGARNLHYRLLEINEAVFFETNPVPIKAMMSLLGLSSSEVRPPLVPASEPLVSRLEGILARCS
jgi:4-hydroxy-tetrahydrodipicolinate synthase